MGVIDIVRGLLARRVDEPDPPLPGAGAGVLEPWHRKPGGLSSGIELDEPEALEMACAVGPSARAPRA